MALVDYSSSSSSSSSDEGDDRTPRAVPTSLHDRQRLKRKRSLSSAEPQNGESSPGVALAVPPPPPAFHDLYATAARASVGDDPALHGGRRRATPHVDGSWPSHVYIESSATTDGRPTQKLNSLLASPLGTPLPLHISLSAPLSIPSKDKDVVLATLRRTLPRGTKNFVTRLEGLRLVSNALKTRCFLVIGIRKPSGDQLNRLLKWCNQACATHCLEELYNQQTAAPEQPRAHAGDRSQYFHFSIAWALEASHLLQHLLQRADVREALQAVERIEVDIDRIKVKIGNVITSMDLGSQDRGEVSGILGPCR